MISIIAVAVLLVAAIAYYLVQLELEPTFYYTAAWILVVLLLLALGNGFLTHQFDKHIPWLKYGNLRFFMQLAIGIIYSLVIINLAYVTFKGLFTANAPTPEQYVVMNAYGLVIFIPFYSIYFSLQFLRHWKKSELDVEKFKKESIRAQLESLKNHLDPHFLFNNLNILSSLIDRGKEQSKAFLDNFAEVYRAILRSKDEDLIPLSDELNFIQSYISLLKTRFEELILFKIEGGADIQNKVIPPLTLQMLIENAIKHNIISEKRSLEVSIAISDEYLIVSNSLNKRPEEPKEQSGSGLENIRRRYRYFTDREIKIMRNASHFTVEVPLIEMEEF
ncbi:sensor histidine kinase [Fulvivirga imtechensis]|nr:histidine kinase [Fulvivirga imtechensis]